jgi:hypothetical protein
MIASGLLPGRAEVFESFFRNKELDFTDSYYKAQRAFQLDPEQDFNKVKNRLGLEASLLYAQIYFSKQILFKKLRREMELHETGQNALNGEHDIVIVLPPHALITQSERQRFLKQCMGLATSAGFTRTSQALLNTESVLFGAQRLGRLLSDKKAQGRKVILISYSFGSAFVRVLLNQWDSEDLSHIKGWMNLSGVIFGSPLFHCSDKKQFLSPQKSFCRAFANEQKYFTQKLQTHHLKVVHFLGLKSGESLSRSERKQRERLRAWGPNDGIMDFAPYQKINQAVVPLLDQGHFIDLSLLSMTATRTLSLMVSPLPQPLSVEKMSPTGWVSRL